MPRKTELVPLGDLQPDPANPKAHDETTISHSISRFGVVDPIVRDDRTGYIISGHGRLTALTAMRDAGQSPPDGVTDTGGEWMVPVSTGWASRSDTEARAALIALNRTTELGGWVDESLLELLTEADDLTGVGYTAADIEALETLGNLDDIPDGTNVTDGGEGTMTTCPNCNHSFEV